MKYLIDTNVISELRKPKCDPRVAALLGAIDNDDLFLSVISIGEFIKGIARLELGARRSELEAWFGQTQRQFKDQILSIDTEIACIWGELTARASQSGKTVAASDGLIAATAIRNGLCLMTRNISDFSDTGVILLDPWG